MTDPTQLIAQFIQQNGISTAILSLLAWFLIMRVWPWYTGQLWPAMLKRQDTRDTITTELRDAVLELRTLTQQLVTAMEQHDASTHDLILAMSSNQQAIMELLGTRTTPITQPPSKN